jgi:hypothetical protein
LLGIEIARSKEGIFLSQQKYILNLLIEISALDCKPSTTSIVENHHLQVYSNQIPTIKDQY